MENLDKRLILLIERFGLNNAQFADAIDVQRSSISHILSGRNKPSFDFLHKIFIKFPEINADWLIMGRGNMFDKTPGGMEQDVVNKSEPILSDSKQLSIEGKENVTDVNIKTLKSSENDLKLQPRIILLHSDGTYSEYKKRND